MKTLLRTPCRWISIFVLFFFTSGLLTRLYAQEKVESSVRPGAVVIAKYEGGWQLRIGGQPFWIKGVGCNTDKGENGENYLKMARDMGANAIRTWGDAPRSYLDAAQSLGLKVDLGIWFNPIRGTTAESYQDAAFCQREQTKALDYVRRLKDHPAILFWNLGNEVFTFTDAPEERKAFGHFLEDLIQAVHREDPLHPVVYAAAGEADFEGLKTYVPSLDILGINTYGGLSGMIHKAQEIGLHLPVIATEFGTVGSWDAPKDRGMPYDPLDQIKTGNFVSLWKQVEAGRPQTLGGFAFVLGNPRNQDSLTWFNMNWKDKKRDSYWTMYQLYTGKSAPLNRPKISQMSLAPSGPVHAGDSLDVHVTTTGEGRLHYEYAIAKVAPDPLVVEVPVMFDPRTHETGPGAATLTAPNRPGSYRVYVILTDDKGNAAVADRALVVIP